jgi:hypothetical protein
MLNHCQFGHQKVNVLGYWWLIVCLIFLTLIPTLSRSFVDIRTLD